MGKSKKCLRQKASSSFHPYRKASHSSKPISNPRPSSKSALKAKISKQASCLPTIPFSPSDQILLVGEGDFSFSHSLLAHHLCTSITATSHDRLPNLLSKYPRSAAHIHALTSAGHTVLHGIDATKLDRPGNTIGGGGKKIRDVGGFDRVVFNFPHTGGLTKDVNRQVRANQELLVGFLRAAVPLLKKCLSPKDEGATLPLLATSANSVPLSTSSRGALLSNTSSSSHEPPTIIVTLFDGEPYTLWNVRDLARHVGLAVRRSFTFDFKTYPGYVHQRTLGNVEGGGGWKGDERGARSYILEMPGAGAGEEGGRKKRGREESDDDSE